jgi:hypothetical protein
MLRWTGHESGFGGGDLSAGRDEIYCYTRAAMLQLAHHGSLKTPLPASSMGLLSHSFWRKAAASESHTTAAPCSPSK